MNKHIKYTKMWSKINGTCNGSEVQNGTIKILVSTNPIPCSAFPQNDMPDDYAWHYR